MYIYIYIYTHKEVSSLQFLSLCSRFGSQEFTAPHLFQGWGGPGTVLFIGNALRLSKGWARLGRKSCDARFFFRLSFRNGL